MSEHVSRVSVIKLIERKLTGQKRQDALRWVRSRQPGDKAMAQFVKRLEPMPDTGADHSRTKYGPEKRAKVCELYAAGLTYQQITEQTGVPHSSVCYITKDLPRRLDGPGNNNGRRIPAIARQGVRDLYLIGIPIAEIRQRYPMSVPTLYAIVADLPKRNAR
jgi:hypothetical protein